MSLYLTVPTRTATGPRKFFASYPEAVEFARNEMEKEGFGRFSDLCVVEIKAILRCEQKTMTTVEITELEELREDATSGKSFWYLKDLIRKD